MVYRCHFYALIKVKISELVQRLGSLAFIMEHRDGRGSTPRFGVFFLAQVLPFNNIISVDTLPVSRAFFKLPKSTFICLDSEL